MKIKEQEIKDLGLTKSIETYIEIRIKANVNDGDYINSTNRVNSIQEYMTLAAITVKIESSRRHNWENACEYLTDDEIDKIYNYLPSMDNEEIHTIESISFTIVADGVIYK